MADGRVKRPSCGCTGGGGMRKTRSAGEAAWEQSPGQVVATFTQRYQSTHAKALSEIRSGRKRSCWSWWIWPTNYQPGASGMSRTYALSDGDAAVFIGNDYLRGCWVEMMSAVAEQLESGVPIRTLCGIDRPRVPATATLFHRVNNGAHADIAAVCDRVMEAIARQEARPGNKPRATNPPKPADVSRARLGEGRALGHASAGESPSPTRVGAAGGGSPAARGAAAAVGGAGGPAGGATAPVLLLARADSAPAASPS
jgi:uncharacterized protein (DUF1810 family)